jgi:hypothetical protein
MTTDPNDPAVKEVLASLAADAAKPAPDAPPEPTTEVPEPLLPPGLDLNLDGKTQIDVFFRTEQQFRLLGDKMYTITNRIPLKGVFPRGDPTFFGGYQHLAKFADGTMRPLPLQFPIPAAGTWDEAWEFFPAVLQAEIDKFEKWRANEERRVQLQGAMAPQGRARRPF